MSSITMQGEKYYSIKMHDNMDDLYKCHTTLIFLKKIQNLYDFNLYEKMNSILKCLNKFASQKLIFYLIQNAGAATGNKLKIPQWNTILHSKNIQDFISNFKICVLI